MWTLGVRPSQTIYGIYFATEKRWERKNSKYEDREMAEMDL